MTTTTTTTVIILATMQTALSLGIFATVALIIALIIKELTTSYSDPKPTVMERVKALSKNAVVVIIPLATVSMLLAAVEIAVILRL